LNLTTKGSDRVYIDTIVIIPSFELDELSYKIKGKISGSNSEKIYLYDSDQYMARSENKDIGQIFSGEFEIFESGDYLLRIYTSDNLSMRSLAIDDIDLDHFNESDYGINVKITKGFHNLTYIVPNSINKTSIFIYFIKNNLNNPQNYNNKTQINFKESAPNRFEISFDKKGENNIRNPILVFTDTYSPSWKLYSSNGEYNHLPVNYQMNGFLINDTRLNNKYILEYNVSDLRKIGILFTTIPFLVLIYIIYYKYKKGWEKLKR
jgi:hypothetical protein